MEKHLRVKRTSPNTAAEKNEKELLTKIALVGPSVNSDLLRSLESIFNCWLNVDRDNGRKAVEGEKRCDENCCLESSCLLTSGNSISHTSRTAFLSRG